jgi:hypothetical protein
MKERLVKVPTHWKSRSINLNLTFFMTACVGCALRTTDRLFPTWFSLNAPGIMHHEDFRLAGRGGRLGRLSPANCRRNSNKRCHPRRWRSLCKTDRGRQNSRRAGHHRPWRGCSTRRPETRQDVSRLNYHLYTILISISPSKGLPTGLPLQNWWAVPSLH